jgi:hypothetical protein
VGASCLVRTLFANLIGTGVIAAINAVVKTSSLEAAQGVSG